jgi:hypothetical protein
MSGGGWWVHGAYLSTFSAGLFAWVGMLDPNHHLDASGGVPAHEMESQPLGVTSHGSEDAGLRWCKEQCSDVCSLQKQTPVATADTFASSGHSPSTVTCSAKAADQFVAIAESSWQCLLLLSDVFGFAAVAAVQTIWPWPVQSLFADVKVGEWAPVLNKTFADVASPGSNQTLGWLPQELQYMERTLSDATRPLLLALRHRFPEHEALNEKREPAHIIFLLLGLFAFFIWQVYSVWVLACIVMKVFVCRPFKMSLRCCGVRQYRRIDGDWEAGGGEPIRIRVRFDSDKSIATLKLKDHTTLVMSHANHEESATFINGKLKFENGEVWTRKKTSSRSTLLRSFSGRGSRIQDEKEHPSRGEQVHPSSPDEPEAPVLEDDY